MPGAIEAYLHMAAAAAKDAADTVTRHPSSDPFEQRDSEYIEQTLPALRLASDLYYRADVRGLHHIPAEGPVLLIGNHSGGTMIADTFVFSQKFYDRVRQAGAPQTDQSARPPRCPARCR